MPDKKCPSCGKNLKRLRGSTGSNGAYKCENTGQSPECKIVKGGFILVPDDIFEVR